MGGGGGGVVNWVKHFLEKEYVSCEKANTVVLVIGGLENDQYILLGGFQIDTSERLSEFFPLRQLPEAIIRNISESISLRLSKEGAGKLPVEIASPLG